MQTTTLKPMTDRQRDYLADLLGKIANPAVQSALKADLNTLAMNRLLDTREASRQIDRLKAVVQAQNVAQAAAPAPVVAPAQPARPVVAQGRYAVEVDGDVVSVFVKIENGRYNVRRYSSERLVPMRWATALKVLRQVEADGEAVARVRFARETVRCFTCGRRLDDKDSKARGQGPDCAGLR